MTDTIAGLPFWEITFDEQGDPDGTANPQAIKEIADRKLTDVVLLAIKHQRQLVYASDI